MEGTVFVTENISLFEWSKLPMPFGVAVLLLLLIFLLSPYFSGFNFGIFNIPQFAETQKRALKIIGPVLFVLSIFSFLPLWTTARTDRASEVVNTANNSSKAEDATSNTSTQASANSSPPSLSRPDQVLNFDTVNTYSDPKTAIDAQAYLGAFGIELANKTTGTGVVLFNHLGMYDGKAFLPVSRPNVLTQINSSEPVNFTLSFSRPLSRLSFVIPPLIAAGATGITFPKWRAYGLDAQGVEIVSVGSDQFGSYRHQDSRTVILEAPSSSGACIKAVRFDSDSEHSAAFQAILIDDLALWYASSNKCQ